MSNDIEGGREPDGVIVWSTYVLALDDVCADAGVPVPPGAELEADFPDRTSIRLTVKHQKSGK